MVTLSDDEYETLRRISFEQRVPVAKLVRQAIDAAYRTNDDEIGPPGPRPKEQRQ